jgi:predicted nucleotidyltransferase
MKDVDEALQDAVEVLERLGVPYAIMGGLAVRIWSIPRATRDVDVTISASPDDVKQLAAAFEKLGYTTPEVHAKGWTDQVADMPLIKFRWYVPGGDLDIDVFIADTPYQHAYMERRQRAQSQGLDMWVVSAEDLVLLKLVAARPRDMIDVADVLFMQGQLDENYMRQWAQRLGVLDSLERALANHPGDERP